jgi:tripartite-type tricarboxylate transporter receptor subunit TctC
MPKWFFCQICLSTLLAFPFANRLLAAELFYQGKTLRVIVASAAGGGSDIVARLMMRHLPRLIPGNPTIVVENMPGAGEIIGTNYVYGKAKRTHCAVCHRHADQSVDRVARHRVRRHKDAHRRRQF